MKKSKDSIDWKRFVTGFGDELIATALVLILTVGGSFYLVNRQLTESTTEEAEPQVIQIKTLGVSDEKTQSTPMANQELLPSPSQAPTPEPSPTPAADLVTVPFGQEGVYEQPEYILKLTQPRLEFKTETTTRTFVIEATLGNKSVAEGLINRLSATLIKDGQVIQDNVALSVSESKTINPSEQITYTASLSLIEGTDVSQINYRPGEPIAETVHVLRP